MEAPQIHKYLSMPAPKPVAALPQFKLPPHPPRRTRPSLLSRLMPTWQRWDTDHR